MHQILYMTTPYVNKYIFKTMFMVAWQYAQIQILFLPLQILVKTYFMTEFLATFQYEQMH
jgi:hypothetical protein